MSTFITALSIGSIYALIALGYNVIYRTTNVFNFAQGAIVAVCALIAFSAIENSSVPVLLTLLICAGAGLVIAVVEYVIAVRPLTSRPRETHIWLVSTLGASVMLEAGAQLIWGPDAHAVKIPALDDFVWVGDANVSVAAFVAIGTAVVATVTLDWWYSRSRTGKLMRAAAEDREAAEARGINTRLLSMLSWALAGALSGAAAIVLLPITLAQPNLSSLLAIKAFVAMAIGGFGSNRGALAGGMIVGLVETYGEQWFGQEYADPAVFVVLLLLLLTMPRGLAGRRQERMV